MLEFYSNTECETNRKDYTSVHLGCYFALVRSSGCVVMDRSPVSLKKAALLLKSQCGVTNEPPENACQFNPLQE